MKKAVAISILLLPLLIGCDVFPKKPTPLVQQESVYVDPRILEACKPLKTLPQDAKDPFLILVNMQENVEIYYDCSQRHDSAVKLIRKFANIKDTNEKVEAD